MALPTVRAQTRPQSDDDYRRPAQSDSRSGNDMRRQDADDVRRRAEDLSRIPQNGADRQDTEALVPYGGPNPDLRGQIASSARHCAKWRRAGHRAAAPACWPAPRQRRAGSGQRRLIPTEVVAETASPTTAQAIAALALRNNLALVDELASQLTGTTLLLLRIPTSGRWPP